MKRFAATLVLCAVSACKGGSDTTCGAGTHAENGVCVITLACGTGTHQSGASCVPDPTSTITCGSGTHQSGSQCVADPQTGIGCGTGAHLDGGTCLPDVTCGAGAVVDGGSCVGALACGSGSHADHGLCVPDVTCGAGTIPSGGECVPATAADGGYEVRLLQQDIVADGYSKVPILAIGHKADGSPANDAVVLGTTLNGAGTFSQQSFTLGNMGNQVFFTPCSSANAGCTGDFQVTLALGSAPNSPVASSWPLTLQAPAGVGSAAPCLAGGNILFFDGDSSDYIHPGTDTITLATWTPYASSTDVRIHVVPSSSAQGLWWDPEFSTAQLGQAMAVQVYDDAERAAFAPPGHPGIDINGDGRGCNTITGKFQVEDIQWSGSTLTSFTATFEQHCEGLAPALRGCIHYGP